MNEDGIAVNHHSEEELLISQVIIQSPNQDFKEIVLEFSTEIT